IDGKIRLFYRPGENQATYYGDDKKVHSFQFQSIMTPNRIMSSLHSPYTGPSRDLII
ncbi:hypothetical protein HOY82DRAFT_489920, partial [Tuber indicum]